MIETLLWVEKYRPTKVGDCILPTQLASTFLGFVEKEEIPNLLLSGSAGVGKTTIAKALCRQLEYEILFLNGSNEGRLIDTLRNKIVGFASSVSLTCERKCVLIDEADAMPGLVQEALRATIELFPTNCSFILTCNFKSRLIEPLRSRFTNIEFVVPQNEQNAVMARFFKRACFILEDNKITYDKQTLAVLVKKFFPDWRRCINELQGYASSGTIDTGILSVIDSGEITKLAAAMKAKDFKSASEWVFGSPSIDMASICRELIVELRKIIKPQFVPGLYVLTADYQHKQVTAIDPHVNFLAYIAAVMMEVEYL